MELGDLETRSKSWKVRPSAPGVVKARLVKASKWIKMTERKCLEQRDHFFDFFEQPRGGPVKHCAEYVWWPSGRIIHKSGVSTSKISHSRACSGSVSRLPEHAWDNAAVARFVSSGACVLTLLPIFIL